MSVTYAMVPGWVLFTDISAQAIRLYATLHHYADRTTRQTWRSRATLADAMHCSRATLDRALRELVHIGAVTITARWRSTNGDISTTRDKIHNEQTSSLYTVRFDDPAEVAPPVTQPCATDDDRVAPPVQHDLKPPDPKPMRGASTARPKPDRPPRPRRVPLPDSWKPKIEECIDAAGFDGERIEREARKFRLWAKASGKVYADWDARFLRWLHDAHPEATNLYGQQVLMTREQAEREQFRRLTIEQGERTRAEREQRARESAESAANKATPEQVAARAAAFRARMGWSA